eukprot:CAMPEP_0168611014 /NCGR_PEP_ID=MMETSP0449_2-20121227/2116_1 /TAXON_ID=1082188 /ORGANISM="Strombidium rassoulzadegani, Strain ras09" /LENGTH=49 /DNA_ID=CAMNT_0008651401 /DNA_START=40 /DNA_END=189 /DNA_ORIENTATION=+
MGGQSTQHMHILDNTSFTPYISGGGTINANGNIGNQDINQNAYTSSSGM